MDTINKTSLTITLNHVLPQETIGDLIKRASLQGQMFKVSITVDEPREKEVTSIHPLADYFENNHPFSGLSNKMNRVNREIRKDMSKKLFDKFAK
ncbi:hypothetical protein PN36_13765 [Candidatus Thiomargarita nelsonii]|uniref:Uncharacterized protein n=1 Tax=Candidatus Thiomargarita nelsonii TaxID=1003181 RepID=A0A0A6P634_9GAMM|nr:hypothetical protein PN36_13765 [Candidatus Thiomargarita nelsonii]